MPPVRKTLEILAFLLLLVVWTITAYAIIGANRLPARIPTHFNATGQPDGWGVPAMLWVLPVIATVIYLLMSLVARYSSSFHFPGRNPPSARLQFEGIALSMLSWLKAQVVCLFVCIQYKTIEFARQGQGTLSPLFMPAVLIVIFGTIVWHIIATRRAARGHKPRL
jgi:uncharacterized membrane protein